MYLRYVKQEFGIYGSRDILIVEYTESVYRDELFVPSKGHKIDFSGVENELPEYEKEKIFEVHEIEFRPNDLIIIRVFAP